MKLLTDEGLLGSFVSSLNINEGSTSDSGGFKNITWQFSDGHSSATYTLSWRQWEGYKEKVQDWITYLSPHFTEKETEEARKIIEKSNFDSLYPSTFALSALFLASQGSQFNLEGVKETINQNRPVRGGHGSHKVTLGKTLLKTVRSTSKKLEKELWPTKE